VGSGEDDVVYSRADAVRIASEFLAVAVRNHRIRRAFLFGSTVWGRGTVYSDIDLALVLESSPEPGEPGQGEEFELFHAAQEHNSSLEVVCFTLQEFDEDGGGLIRRIKQAGLELPITTTEAMVHPA
jgi:hypothetical protein